jgi:hypothetical protein
MRRVGAGFSPLPRFALRDAVIDSVPVSGFESSATAHY